jgi:MaoC like domain
MATTAERIRAYAGLAILRYEGALEPGGRIAHRALLVGYMLTASTAHVIHQEGLTDFPVSAGYDKLRFLKPVMLGDTVTVTYPTWIASAVAARQKSRCPIRRTGYRERELSAPASRAGRSEHLYKAASMVC